MDVKMKGWDLVSRILLLLQVLIPLQKMLGMKRANFIDDVFSCLLKQVDPTTGKVVFESSASTVFQVQFVGTSRKLFNIS